MSNYRIVSVIGLIIFVNSVTLSQFSSAPHLSQSIQDISQFIASDQFKEFQLSNDSFAVVDSLYSFALNYCNNNVEETLLALTFATLPYYEMPLSIPLLKKTIYIPLPAPTKDVFISKQKHLPSNIFFDVKRGSDKDKLAHFFGNAYLAYNVDAFNLSKFMSIFVELFEHAFKVEGAIDYRDLIVNSLGDEFGVMLLTHANTKPSQVLKMYFLYHLIPGN